MKRKEGLKKVLERGTDSIDSIDSIGGKGSQSKENQRKSPTGGAGNQRDNERTNEKEEEQIQSLFTGNDNEK